MYYGINFYTYEPIEIDRRNLSISANRLIFGAAGTGRIFLIKHEILSVLSEKEDTVFVITADENYNEIAEKYGKVISVHNENVSENKISIPHDKRFVVFDLANVSRFQWHKAYRLCLETIQKYTFEESAWIYADEIQHILRDKYVTGLLYDIFTSEKTHNCIITLSTQAVSNLTSEDIGKHILMQTNFLTFLSISEDDREIILRYFGKLISESVLNEYCGSFCCGTGLHFINNKFIPYKFPYHRLSSCRLPLKKQEK